MVRTMEALFAHVVLVQTLACKTPLHLKALLRQQLSLVPLGGVVYIDQTMP